MKKTIPWAITWIMALTLLFNFNSWGQTTVDIVSNGDFENWTADSPDNWVGSVTNLAASNILEYTASAQSGTSSCQLINTSGSHQRFSTEPLSILADTEYTVTYYARGKGEIRNAFYRDGNYSTYSNYTILDTDTWTEIVYTFEYSAAVNDVQVIFSLRNTDAVRDHIQIDNVSATYQVQEGVVATPTFSPTGGDFYADVDVTIETVTADATIFYSTDSDTGPWTEYTAPVTITGNTTLYAYATATDLTNSNVASAAYNFPAVTEVPDIATLRAGATDGTIYKLTGEAILTFATQSRNQKYIQDATGAVLIDDSPGNLSTSYQLYDGITGIIGTLGFYQDMLQFVPVTDAGTPSSQDNVVDPLVLTIDQINTSHQAHLVTIVNTTIDPGSDTDFASSKEYAITDATGTGILRTNYFDLEYLNTPIPVTPQTITGVLHQRYDDVRLVPRNLSDFQESQIPTARAQIIHNSADAAATSVDIFVNGELFYGDLNFREATPFVDVPSGVDLTIDIVPAGLGIEASVFNLPDVQFIEDETYLIVASGIVSDTGYDPLTPFSLELFAGARETAEVATDVDLLVYHGATDAPGVNVDARYVGNLVNNAEYSNFAGYLNVPAAYYTLDVAAFAAPDDIIVSFGADLRALEGGAATVIASGFLDPSVNSDGAGFALLAVLADGSVVELPVAMDYEFDLSGLVEVPSNLSDGTGSGMLTVAGNVTQLSGSFSGLGSAYTMSHIHIAAAGANGGVAHALTAELDGDELGGSYDPFTNTFDFSQENIDQLTAGELYVNIHSTDFPAGEIRGQILPSPNTAPTASSITVPADGAAITIEGDPATPFVPEWDAATDDDGNLVAYVWQLAADDAFTNILVNASTGTTTRFETDFATVTAILDDAGVAPGESITVYHRAVSTDGSIVTFGNASSVILTAGPPQLAVDKNTVDFGNSVYPGQTVTQNIVVSNAGFGTITLNEADFTITGTDAASFNMIFTDDVTLPVELGTAESYNLTLTFTPDEVRAYEATLEIDDNLLKGITTVSLTGTGYDPTVTPEFVYDFIGDFPPLDWANLRGVLSDNTQLTPGTFWKHEKFTNDAGLPVKNSAKINIYDERFGWLVTPPIDLGDGATPYMLSFDMGLTEWDNSTPGTLENKRIAVVISTDNGTTWSDADILREWVEGDVISNVGQKEIIDLSAYNGIVKIGFYAESTAKPSDVDLFITNVGVEEAVYQTVTFNITDIDDIAITDASVTFNGETITAAPYEFASVSGTYSYEVSKDGYQIATGSVTVADLNVAVDVVLEEIFTVDFTVTDFDLTPLAGAEIAISGDSALMVTTDAMGMASVELVNGTYQAVISMMDYMDETIDIIVNEAPLDFDVELADVVDAPYNLMVEVTGQDALFSWNNPELVESFEGGTMPEGWSQIITNTGSNDLSGDFTWQITGTVELDSRTITPQDGDYQAFIMWSNDAQDEWLITPEFEAPGGDLVFWYHGTNGSVYGDNYYVKVSTDDGSTWTTLWNASDLPPGENKYDVPAVVDLSAYAGQNIKVAWNGVDGDGQGLWYAWAIDNITIGGELLDIKDLAYVSKTGNQRNTINPMAKDGLYKESVKATDMIQPSAEKAFTGYTVFLNDAEVATDVLITEYQFTDLPYGTHTAGVSSNYSSGPSEMVTIEFTIELPEYTLTVEAAPAGAGTVTGGGDYKEGAIVPVTATPADGYQFVNWTVADVEVSTDAVFDYTMPGAATTLVANFETIPPVDVATLAELRALPSDGTHYRYTGDAVIVAMDGFRNRKFLQDATAAIMIYDADGTITTEYDLYDVISNVTGYTSVFRNLLQLIPLDNTAESTVNTPVEPAVFTLDGVTQDDQAKLIKFENVTFVGIEPDSLFDNGENYTITDGTNTFVLRTDFWNTDIFESEIPTDPVNITGVVITYNETLQIVPRFAADIEALYTLTLVADPVDGGTVSGEGTYTEGTMVTLNATAAEGYVFKDWTNAGGTVVSTEAGFDYTMPAEATTLTANFDIIDNVENLGVAFNIFPNPARDNFTIKSGATIRTLVISDITGKVVYNDVVNNNEIRIQNEFDTGIYILHIHTDEGVAVRKLQIQK